MLMSTAPLIYSDVVFWVVTPCGLRSWMPTSQRNIFRVEVCRMANCFLWQDRRNMVTQILKRGRGDGSSVFLRNVGISLSQLRPITAFPLSEMNFSRCIGLEGQGVVVLFPSRGKSSSVPTQTPIQWVPGALSAGYSGSGVTLITHRLVQRLRIRGAISPSPLIRIHGVMLN
jgi:hypothetical protein